MNRKIAMQITHSYEGIGLQYQKARKGTPAFAKFMISNAGINSKVTKNPFTIAELGIGSGQQTEFVEKELNTKGYTQYTILAYDKSYHRDIDKLSFNFNPGQLNLLIDRIGKGELTKKIIPNHFDFDGALLPLRSGSVDLIYMAHVLHHLRNKERTFEEISRVLAKHGRFFILGVTIEDLKNHPLNDFFPEKYEYDTIRYHSETQIKKIFKSAGFTWENPYRIGRDQVKPMDRDFLASVENTTIDSVLKMIRDNDPAAFELGVQKVRREVERAEKTGSFRTYFTTIAKVFWGIKK
jgi:ubiquinone/menaquinone biosynthesis C-methylase UbiE